MHDEMPMIYFNVLRNNVTAKIMADFFTSWLTRNGFDGLYLDGYEDPNLQSATSGLLANRSYDVNGDGVVDSFAEIREIYQAWASGKHATPPGFIAKARSWEAIASYLCRLC